MTVTLVVLIALVLIFVLIAVLSPRRERAQLERLGADYIAARLAQAQLEESYRQQRVQELSEKEAVIRQLRMTANFHRKQNRAG